jgi:DNA-binding NarL/FixJ family response regulator
MAPRLRTLLITEDEELTLALIPELEKMLDSEVLHAITFRIALAEMRGRRFDCAIVDRNIGGGDGFALAPLLRRGNSDVICIALTTSQRWVSSEALLALGYRLICNRMSPVDLIVRDIYNAIYKPLGAIPSPLTALTDRELEILRDISSGMKNQEIAAHRSIAETTIKSHCASIYRKLGVRNRVEAAALLKS